MTVTKSSRWTLGAGAATVAVVTGAATTVSTTRVIKFIKYKMGTAYLAPNQSHLQNRLTERGKEISRWPFMLQFRPIRFHEI